MPVLIELISFCEAVVISVPYRSVKLLLFPKEPFPVNEYVMFKFRAINKYLIEGLVHSTIFCASPYRLNDPFDCRVDIAKAAHQAISELDGKEKDVLTKLVNMNGYLDRVQSDAGNVAVCSFSLALEDPLLWAHYADEHRGLCLAYNFPESFLSNPEEIVGVAPVEYGENPLTKWFIENIPTQQTDFKEFTLSLIKKVLTIKGRSWECEKEVRIIRKKEGPFLIEKAHLKQICFGLNTSKSDLSLIQKLVKDAGYSVDYCKIARCNSDFGIKAKDI
jgi:hypothetical protein